MSNTDWGRIKIGVGYCQKCGRELPLLNPPQTLCGMCRVALLDPRKEEEKKPTRRRGRKH